jgi:hypothetical protein
MPHSEDAGYVKDLYLRFPTELGNAHHMPERTELIAPAAGFLRIHLMLEARSAQCA